MAIYIYMMQKVLQTNEQDARRLFISPPLKRWGHVGLPLSAQFVSVRSLRQYVPFISAQRFLSCRRSNTRR